MTLVESYRGWRIKHRNRVPMYLARMAMENAAIHGTSEQFSAAVAAYLKAKEAA